MEAIFDNEPTVTTLIKIAIFLAIFWATIFTAAKPIIALVIKDKQWLRDSSNREYERSKKWFKEQAGIDFTEETYFEYYLKNWPNIQLIVLQHLVGGSLCLPSILGGWVPLPGLKIVLDDSTCSSLACLGILSEIGWEIQDIFTIFYKRFCTPSGNKLIPNVMLIISLLHHSLATTLGIPLILHYRNFKVMHWICLDLQAAGAVVMGVGEYTKLLDISVPFQLLQFQVLTFLTLLAMIWTRIIHWFYLMSQFLIVWYNEKAWTLLIIGLIVCALFTLFSVSASIVPLYQRFMKFLKVKADHQSLPANTDELTKRKSMRNLQLVAADVHTSVDTLEDDLIKTLFQDYNSEGVSMRQSMPPLSTFRRSSMLLNSSEIRDAMRRMASYHDLKKDKVH